MGKEFVATGVGNGILEGEHTVRACYKRRVKRIFTPCEFFIPILTGGFSLEAK